MACWRLKIRKVKCLSIICLTALSIGHTLSGGVSCKAILALTSWRTARSCAVDQLTAYDRLRGEMVKKETLLIFTSQVGSQALEQRRNSSLRGQTSTKVGERVKMCTCAILYLYSHDISPQEHIRRSILARNPLCRNSQSRIALCRTMAPSHLEHAKRNVKFWG